MEKYQRYALLVRAGVPSEPSSTDSPERIDALFRSGLGTFQLIRCFVRSELMPFSAFRTSKASGICLLVPASGSGEAKSPLARTESQQPAPLVAFGVPL